MRVVAGRHDGIGTRLLTLMAGRYFAQAAGLPVSFIWPSLHDPLYTSNDLLKFGSSGEIFRDARVFKDLDGPPVADWDQDTKFFAVSWLTEPATVDNVLQGAKDVDVVLYNVPHMIVGTEGHETGAGSYARLWRSFNFSEEVTGAYNQIVAERKDYVAIHMRRGDTARMLAESPLDYLEKFGFDLLFQRYMPLQQAASLANRYLDGDKPIIVVSEDAEMAGKLAALLPNRTVTGTAGHFKHDGTQQALLDLIVLAGSKSLLSPPCSFFSECAVKVSDTVNYKADFELDALASELLPLLETSGVADVALRKAMFLEAGQRAAARVAL